MKQNNTTKQYQKTAANIRMSAVLFFGTQKNACVKLPVS